MTSVTQTNNAPAISQQQMTQINHSAKEFCAMFYGEMLGHMFEGMKTDPMFGGGHGEEMFRGMMVQEYGKMMSQSPSGIKIADQVQKAMIQIQQNQMTTKG